MLKILTFTLALLISPIALADAEIDKPAPQFSTTDTNGNNVSIADLKGKLVVLEWTNHDCPFVKKHYESDNMQSLQKKYTDQDVVWLSIISSAPGNQGNVLPEEANELTESRNASPSAVILDPTGEIGQLYGAKTTPHMFIIDKEGNLAYKGAIDDKPSANKNDVEIAKNYVDRALTQMMTGGVVTDAETKQYGCGVKY